MYKETFGQRLKQARKETGYTLKEIQEFLKIPYSTLSRYETGAREPDIETLGKLIDFYEINADWLLGTKGNNR